MRGSYGPWHRWYAWRPVQTEQHGWRWLRTVQRARYYFPDWLHGAPGPIWVYQPLNTDRRQP